MQEVNSFFYPEAQLHLQQSLKGRTLTETFNDVLIVKWIIGVVKEGLDTGNSSQAQQEVYEILVGPHGRPLADKSRFPGIMRGLGFQAPESLLVTPTLPIEIRVQAIAKHFPESLDFFVKPLNGSRQRDVDMVPRAELLNEEGPLSHQKEMLLVQDYMPHQLALRYIWYKDGEDNVYSACFAYTEVDEEHRMQIPLIGSRIISASGETVEQFVGNFLNTRVQPITNGPLKNINHFMTGVIRTLEDSVGGELPFFSCDLGVVDRQLLRDPYDEASMNSNLVFFETQALPNPWEIRGGQFGKNSKAYLNMWRLMFKEHGREMRVRMRKKVN